MSRKKTLNTALLWSPLPPAFSRCPYPPLNCPPYLPSRCGCIDVGLSPLLTRPWPLLPQDTGGDDNDEKKHHTRHCLGLLSLPLSLAVPLPPQTVRHLCQHIVIALMHSLAPVQEVVATNSFAPKDTKLDLPSFTSIVPKQGPCPKVQSFSADNIATIYNHLKMFAWVCCLSISLLLSVRLQTSGPQTSLFFFT